MKKCLDSLHPLVIICYYLFGFAGVMIMPHPILLSFSFFWLMVDECYCAGIKKTVKALAAGIGFAFLIILVNLLVNHRGPTVIMTVFGLRITLESLGYGVLMAGVFLVCIRLFMGLSREMTDEKILTLMGRRLPGMALLFSMTLRLVPSVRRDMREFRLLHGMGGGVFRALFNKTLVDGIVRSMSMHARGYQGGITRSCYYRRRMRLAEWLILCLITGWLCVMLCFRIQGGISFRFFPTIQIEPVSVWVAVLWCVYMAVPVLTGGKEEVLWIVSRRKSIDSAMKPLNR